METMLFICFAESFAHAKVSYGDTTIEFSSFIQSITFNGNSSYYGYGAAMSFIYFAATLVTIGVVCGIVSKGGFYYDQAGPVVQQTLGQGYLQKD